MLDVPFKLMMTLNTAQQGPLKQPVEEKEMSPTIILALHLMNEQLNPASFFRPWLSALPQTFETPLFWSEEDLAGLQGSTIGRKPPKGLAACWPRGLTDKPAWIVCARWLVLGAWRQFGAHGRGQHGYG